MSLKESWTAMLDLPWQYTAAGTRWLSPRSVCVSRQQGETISNPT